MEGEPATVGEAIADASDAARQAASLAEADAARTVAAVVESAAVQIDAAQELASETLRAAMETALGREISETNRRLEEWRAGDQERSQQLSALTAEVSELRSQIAATATVAVAAALTETPSIPAPLAEDLTAATAEVAEILPEALSPEPAASTPSAPPKVRRKQYL